VKTMQKVWTYRGIMYVPHFSRPGVWVSPGYPRKQQVEFDAARLRKLGAIESNYYLFAKPN